MNGFQHRVTKDVLASKGQRLGNFIIDYIVLLLISLVIGVLIGVFSELTGNYAVYDFIVLSESKLIDYTFTIMIWLIYYSVIETLTSRSIGKYITKTKVVMKDGSKPTFDEILVRSLCRFIPFEPFSLLGDDGRGWHDSISKTYVVNIEKFESKKETIEDLEDIGRIAEH